MKLVDKVLKNVVFRIGEALLDAFKALVSTSVMILSVLCVALILNFLPAWTLIVAVIVLLLAIVYVTYKSELHNIDDED